MEGRRYRGKHGKYNRLTKFKLMTMLIVLCIALVGVVVARFIHSNKDTDIKTEEITAIQPESIELHNMAYEIHDDAIAHEPSPIDMPVEEPITYDGFDVDTDYCAIMCESIINGTHDLGREAAEQRNLKIETLGIDAAKIDYDDLLLLSKIIEAECGSTWLPTEWKMDTGEVVMNRVASSEFANTIRDVIYSPGQYGPVIRGTFEGTVPDMDEIEVAIRLLSGERTMCPSVVFQAEFHQGSGVYRQYNDSVLGTTYFCISSHPDLYE